MKAGPIPLRCPCAGAHFAPVFAYEAPPQGEVRFPLDAPGGYRRQIRRCALCSHFVSVHAMGAGPRYSGEYVDSTYGGLEGIRRAFERITALEPSRSDNVGRAQRFCAFAAGHLSARPPAVLDVGSGLCVFLHRLKAAGWDCTALDPDPRAVQHARETVGVKAVCGDFMLAQGLGRFDAVSFNKVLEHVGDPVGMLARAREHLRPEGFVYVEVPDGEMAALDGPGREEFFIDHLHVFSAASLALLAGRAGFAVRALERLCEPSTKYTLRAFLTV